MASIRCLVSTCRFNARHACTLGTVQIAVGSVATIAPSLEPFPDGTFDNQFRAGYAGEFAAYAQWATSLSVSEQSGAVCVSFAPL